MDLDVPRLTRLVARGNSAAFAAIYDAFFDRCYALARRISRRDESFCLDIVQEVMLRAIKGLRPLADERALAAWFTRTVLNATIDEIRRNERRGSREAEAARRRDDARAVDDREERLWVEQQTAALSAVDQRLFAERFGRGRSLAEAGAAANLSGNAAHGRLRRAILKMRKAAMEVFS